MSGGGGNDTLIGSPAADRLLGGNGRDFIHGGGGNDGLMGGEGADLVVGGGGADHVSGWLGEDFLIGAGLTYVTEATGAVGLTAIAALTAEWTRADGPGHLLRAKRLLGELTGGRNGSYVVSAAAVVADRALDTLHGDSRTRDVLVRGSGPTDTPESRPGEDELIRDLGRPSAAVTARPRRFPPPASRAPLPVTGPAAGRPAPGRPFGPGASPWPPGRRGRSRVPSPPRPLRGRVRGGDLPGHGQGLDPGRLLSRRRVPAVVPHGHAPAAAAATHVRIRRAGK